MQKIINLNEIPSIKEWGINYLIPRLELIDQKIGMNKELRLNYHKIEMVFNDTYYSWLLGVATKATWERNEYYDISEVVLAANCQISDERIIFDFDVSLEDGDVFYEVDHPIKILVDSNTNKEQIETKLGKQADLFFDNVYEYIVKGVFYIENKTAPKK